MAGRILILKRLKAKEYILNIVKKSGLFVYFSIALLSCNPWENSQEAHRHGIIERNGYYYAYYTQSMWDAELEFVIKTKHKPLGTLKSPNGELSIERGETVYKSAVTTNNCEKRKFKEVNGKVKIFTEHHCNDFKN
jgi:hypothetical protein